MAITHDIEEMFNAVHERIQALEDKVSHHNTTTAETETPVDSKQTDPVPVVSSSEVTTVPAEVTTQTNNPPVS